VRVCSLSFPACNVHAPYCHLWPARLYNTFPHYRTKGRIFEETLLNIKCVFWFPLRQLGELLSCMYTPIHIVYPLFLPDLNETWIFSKYFEKQIFQYQISWTSVYWEQTCSMRMEGRTDRHTDMTKLIVAIRSLANAPESYRRVRRIDELRRHVPALYSWSPSSNLGLQTGYQDSEFSWYSSGLQVAMPTLSICFPLRYSLTKRHYIIK
jgi:hypothetical protein